MTATLASAAKVSRVVGELNWDPRMDATQIHVSDEDGVIRLAGKVHTYAEKVAAQEAAHRVLGVDDVANDIEVLPMGTTPDADIAHAVRHALEWDALVPHGQIQSTVSGGWVTLEGSVPYYYQREDAYDAVSRLVGVRGVTNRISIDPEAGTPIAAHDAIYQALQRQAGREADRIAVSFDGGMLVVSGEARSWAEKRAIIGAATGVPGVRMVQDQIRVVPYA